MKIPAKFQLHGIPIKVIVSPDLLEGKAENGTSSFVYRTITLQSKGKRSKELVEKVFCHELLHLIFLHVGRNWKLNNGKELWEDEDLVEQCAFLLHQSLNSMEGEVEI
jgi:hypothetical protein